jgi:hypothetical protein
MNRPPPPSVERLIEAGKKGVLSHQFIRQKPYAHEARVLFFSVLDEEWPQLKRDLFHRCWPLFQEACAPFIAMSAGEKPWWAVPVQAGPEQFVIPVQLFDFRHLEVSEDFQDLRREFLTWSEAGRGIRDEWFIESAFHTLRSAAPASKETNYDGSDQPWLYPFEFRHPHRCPPPAPLVDVTAPPSMIDEARRDYRKEYALRFQVPKDMSSDHARWTVARLSDPNLSWSGLMDRFPQLKVYDDGVSEAKRRVKKFARWIDLNLSVQNRRGSNCLAMSSAAVSDDAIQRQQPQGAKRAADDK